MSDYEISQETYDKLAAAVLEAVPTARIRYNDGRLEYMIGTVDRKTVRKAAFVCGVPSMCGVCFAQWTSNDPHSPVPDCLELAYPPLDDCGAER